jgi:hypothetical protein
MQPIITSGGMEICQDPWKDIQTYIMYIWKDGDIIKRWRCIWRDPDTHGRVKI